MRYLPDVIDEIIPLIPVPEHRELIEILGKISDSAVFAPPWGQQLHWRRMADALYTHLGRPDRQWKRRIQSVIRDA